MNFIDVSNITSLNSIFSFHPDFNGDISKWDVSNVTEMSYLFIGTQFNGDISAWDVSNVTDFSFMFHNSKFNGDLSKWNVSDTATTDEMFSGTPLEAEGKLPKWYKK